MNPVSIWVVGFNGFHQIDSFCDTDSESESGQIFDFKAKHSTPSKMSLLADRLVDTKRNSCVWPIIAWSKILIVSGEYTGSL